MAIEDDIRDLRLRLVRLETQMGQLFEHLGLAMEDEVAIDADTEVLNMINGGDEPGAVKKYQEIHKTTREDAEQAVAEMRRQQVK